MPAYLSSIIYVCLRWPSYLFISVAYLNFLCFNICPHFLTYINCDLHYSFSPDSLTVFVGSAYLSPHRYIYLSWPSYPFRPVTFLYFCCLHICPHTTPYIYRDLHISFSLLPTCICAVCIPFLTSQRIFVVTCITFSPNYLLVNVVSAYLLLHLSVNSSWPSQVFLQITLVYFCVCIPILNFLRIFIENGITFFQLPTYICGACISVLIPLG